MKGLITTVAQAVPLEKQPQMLNRLAQGLFTLRDMRDQFNVSKVYDINDAYSHDN
jgi:signal recognition particle subunit SRP54